MFATADQLHDRATRVRTRYNQQQQRLQCLDIAAQLSVIGWNLEKQGIYLMAEKTYRRVVDIYDRQLGESTQTAVTSVLERYSELLDKTGNPAQAKQITARVTSIRKAAYAPSGNKK